METLQVTSQELETRYNDFQGSSLRSIKYAKAYEDSAIKILHGKFSGVKCDLAPKSEISFRPGEITVWGGINGHGKSLITSQVALQLIARGEKVFIMSFEMVPARTLLRMVTQTVGHQPSIKEIKAANDWFGRRLLIFDGIGIVGPNEVIGAMMAAADDFGATHIIVDNLMTVVAGEDHYNEQKNFVRSCCDLAHARGIHVHLVHHVRKPDTKTGAKRITKFDLRGAASIADQADNILLIQRNEFKEEKRRNGILTPITDEEEPDVWLTVAKQRNGDFEGVLNLWYAADSKSFCTTVERTPLAILNVLERNS